MVINNKVVLQWGTIPASGGTNHAINVTLPRAYTKVYSIPCASLAYVADFNSTAAWYGFAIGKVSLSVFSVTALASVRYYIAIGI